RELSGVMSRERQAHERLAVCERSISAVDELARREAEVRQGESKRVWDALDNHTHDLSTQVIEMPGDDDVYAEESYSPFPCQPMASLLRLGSERDDHPKGLSVRSYPTSPISTNRAGLFSVLG
ncbi:unnamed protein product, partial [Polarella glacialis]